MRSFSKRTIAVAGTAAVALTAAGVAYAYYAGNIAGTGTGTATPAANTSLDITFAGSGISLQPGGSATTTVTFTNPNSWAVSYAAKTVSVSSVTSAAAGCSSNAVALLSGSANLPAGVLAAGATRTLDITVSMADSLTVDQTACAGVPLTVTYAAA